VPASMPSRIARAASRNGVLAFSPVNEDVSTKRTPGVSSAGIGQAALSDK
jgi:hypothetical protein